MQGYYTTSSASFDIIVLKLKAGNSGVSKVIKFLIDLSSVLVDQMMVYTFTFMGSPKIALGKYYEKMLA